MKLIRYHLPTIVKHVLAPKNDFGIQKTLGKFTKVLGFEKTPPPPLGKIPKKSRFFFGQRPLKSASAVVALCCFA